MIPSVNDLRSSPMAHRFGDLFNPPGLTNFLGCVQTDLDPVAIRSLNFPPFACSDTVTGSLYVNGKFFQSTGSAVTTTWYPDRIEREAEHDGFRIHSKTVLVPREMGCVVQVEIRNISGEPRTLAVKLGLRSFVTKAVKPWNEPLPPAELDNAAEASESRGAVIFSALNSDAVLVQGCDALPDRIWQSGLAYHRTVPAGEAFTFTFVNAIGETGEAALELFERLRLNGRRVVEQVEAFWNDELQAVFTPGNDRYSGSMPVLETTDRDLLKIYHIGVVGVIYFKRDTPHSVYGRAYDTLMPRYWQSVTFLWDYALSSLTHALLDPAVMRKYLELWMRLDIHKHFGTEYLTGSGVGPWYSVNDFAMCGIARDYLRWNGDFAWLDGPVPGGDGGTARDYLLRYAENWKRFKTKNGLADYGGLNNLLECVNSYVHEVASLNAANVFNMRFAADLKAMSGRSDEAEQHRREAAKLIDEVRKLYARGRGFWHARMPDGRLVEVRHIYDFITVLNTIGRDLTADEQAEMVAFFQRELQTPRWMHALSCDDDDALFSVRPDHQWTGAYPAWPPQAVTGLYKIGRDDVAAEWLRGLAKSANQGPFGQAHFAESVVAPEDGGALKAPPDIPYITDWTCSSNGSWTNIIIESIFGIEATLQEGLKASPRLDRFDPKAALRNVAYQGRFYDVTADGVRETAGIPAEVTE